MAIQSISSTPAGASSDVAADRRVNSGNPPPPVSDGNTPAPIATQTTQAVRQTGETSRPTDDKGIKKEGLQRELNKINEFIGARTADLQFSIDDDTNIRVVKVIDRTTKDVIRQIPTREVIQIAKTLDHLQGLLLRDKA